MKIEGLEQRREKRIEAKRKAGGNAAAWKAANEALAERNSILADFRAMPLKKLRAIHKAAQQAFAKKP